MSRSTSTSGHLACLHFPRPRLTNYINAAKVKEGQVFGTFAEIHFSDKRFDKTVFSSDSIIRQIVNEINNACQLHLIRQLNENSMLVVK